MIEKGYVYNLVFPEFCDELTIFNYRFTKTENYYTNVNKLQNLNFIPSDMKIKENTGENTVTAIVEIPNTE